MVSSGTYLFNAGDRSLALTGDESGVVEPASD